MVDRTDQLEPCHKKADLQYVETAKFKFDQHLHADSSESLPFGICIVYVNRSTLTGLQMHMFVRLIGGRVTVFIRL